MFIVEIKTAF